MIPRLQPIVKRAFSFIPTGLKVGMRRGLDEYASHRRHLAVRRQMTLAAAAISDHCLKGIYALEDWQRQRPVARQQLLSMLALDPLPERTPLRAQIAGILERSGYRIEKLVFESVPGLYVTANFYLPHDRPSPLPCIVYLNGHSPSLDGAKTIYQTPSLWYPANGFALLVVDPLGFGEIPGVHAGMNRLNQWHWLSLGYTPAGVEVWNAMRALDWLATRSEIDMSRIGMTGISGGGVMTQFVAALDERVAVAAPSCSTYTVGDQVAKNLIPQQCDCTFFPNVFHMDFPAVLALIAPRPLMILGGRKDPIFPPAGFRAAFRRTKMIYDLFGEDRRSEPRIRLVESGQGHTDPPRFLSETHRWMCQWLRTPRKISLGSESPGVKAELPETLRCIEKPPATALNYSIHDVWVRRRTLAVPLDLESWTRRREELDLLLRTRIFGWFPQAEIAFRTRRRDGCGGYAGEFAKFSEWEFDSEAQVPIRASLLEPWGQVGAVPLIVWIKGAMEHVAFPDVDEFFPLLRTCAVLIVTPRFADRPLAGRDRAQVERTAALTGRSMAAMQVWDVLRTVAWAIRDRRLQTAGVAVFGSGEIGVAGVYAALMDPTIGHVILRNPPATHLDGFVLPAILRDTDIEEVAGMLAPRRLTILGPRQEGFSMTRSIFGLLGAEAAFRHSPSLPEALGKEVADRSGTSFTADNQSERMGK